MTDVTLLRAAAFIARKDAPIRCTLATPTPLVRDDGWEVLDCSAQGCDRTRGDLSLIVGHDHSALAVSIVSGIRADGSKVSGEVRFASSPEAQQLRADVLAGIHRYLSVGYATWMTACPTTRTTWSIAGSPSKSLSSPSRPTRTPVSSVPRRKAPLPGPTP